jgi:hypothetical protein
MLKDDASPKSNAEGLRPKPEIVPVPQEPAPIAANAVH